MDTAYAVLPVGARTDRMLGVAQQFVDAGQAAAAAGNWNLVQTLETAADVSLQIAAQPEGSRTAVTERFMHKGTKHDITVDPNAADPFASFKDHSKGQEVVGAIVEGVVGVVLNVLAVLPTPLAAIALPLAISWDAAQAGKNFADGNILGGFLSLASAVGVGLSGLDAISSAAEAASAAGDSADSFAMTAGDLVNSFAEDTLGTTTAQLGTLGREIGEGVALVGGASGIAQSAANNDPLGIAAGVLEVTAAVAGGLLSTDQVLRNPALSQIVKNVAIYGGLASVAASSADAFARGDLAGGLASSLSVLLSQVAQWVGERAGPANQPVVPASATGGDDLPSLVAPTPQSAVALSGTGETIEQGFLLEASAAQGGTPSDPLQNGTVHFTPPDGTGPQTGVIVGRDANGYYLQGGGYISQIYVASVDFPPPTQAPVTQGGGVVVVGSLAAARGSAETFAQWAARLLGITSEIAGGVTGGAIVFTLTPTAAGTPYQTSATAVEGFTTNTAQDEMDTTLRWTDTGGNPASIVVLRDPATGRHYS